MHVFVLVSIVLVVSAIVLRVTLIQTAIRTVAGEATIMLGAVVIETIGHVVTMVIIVVVLMMVVVGVIVAILITVVVIVVGVKWFRRSVVLRLPLLLLVQLLLQHEDVATPLVILRKLVHNILYLCR